MALPIGSPRPCKGCGIEILKSKFCTASCRVDWYQRTQKERDAARCREAGIRTWSERYPDPPVRDRSGLCAVCFSPFDRKRGRNDAGLCCSRECGFELLRQRGAQSKAVTEAKLEFARWARLTARAKILKPVPAPKTCRDCGTVIDKGKQRCEPCKAEATAARPKSKPDKTLPAYRASRSRCKARRRMREREQRVETFDPFAIFDRDKWRCHICGCNTPKRLRGTFEPNAPELDHIIPLAAGGEHSRRNTACSCRRCNIAKADKPFGQLSMAI